MADNQIELTTTKQTPRGSVVVLGTRLLTDEMDTEGATALSASINLDLIKGNVTDANTLSRHIFA